MKHKYKVAKSEWEKFIYAIENNQITMENEHIDSFNCNVFIDGHDFYLLFQTLIKEGVEIMLEFDDYSNENDYKFENYKSISTRTNPVSHVHLNIKEIKENMSNGECRFYGNDGSFTDLKYTLVIFDENPKIETTYVKRGFECKISSYEHNNYVYFLISKCKVIIKCCLQEFLRIMKLMIETKTQHDNEKEGQYKNKIDTDEAMRSYLSIFHDEAWKAYIAGLGNINVK